MVKRAKKPVTLDDLEQQYLSGESRARRQQITVREIETVRKLEDDRFRRRLSYLFAATVIGLVAVAVTVPTRADVVKGLMESMLVAISSYVLGRYGPSAKRDSP